MGYKLNVLLREELEVAEAIEYYSEINDELAAKFLDNLESAYSHLKSNPYFQKRYRNIRGLPIKNFPYLLLFTIDKNKKEVEVLSCFQTAQNPKKYPD